MEFEELAEQMTQALVKQLAVIDQRQAEQRERWFEEVNGVKVERRETYEIGGQTVELPVIGMECPSRLDLEDTFLKTKNDLVQEKKDGVFKVLVGFFSGKADKSSPVEFGFTLKRGLPSRGIMALYNRAGNEIAKIAQGLGPQVVTEVERIRATHNVEGDQKDGFE